MQKIEVLVAYFKPLRALPSVTVTYLCETTVLLNRNFPRYQCCITIIHPLFYFLLSPRAYARCQERWHTTGEAKGIYTPLALILNI